VASVAGVWLWVIWGGVEVIWESPVWALRVLSLLLAVEGNTAIQANQAAEDFQSPMKQVFFCASYSIVVSVVITIR